MIEKGRAWFAGGHYPKFRVKVSSYEAMPLRLELHFSGPESADDGDNDGQEDVSVTKCVV